MWRAKRPRADHYSSCPRLMMMLILQALLLLVGLVIGVDDANLASVVVVGWFGNWC